MKTINRLMLLLVVLSMLTVGFSHAKPPNLVFCNVFPLWGAEYPYDVTFSCKCYCGYEHGHTEGLYEATELEAFNMCREIGDNLAEYWDCYLDP